MLLALLSELMPEWICRGSFSFVGLCILFCKNRFDGFASWFSGEFCFVTCGTDNLYCTLPVTIVVVNTMMIVMHANMPNSKQSGGNVRPD
jgi:hypothetical protein